MKAKTKQPARSNGQNGHNSQKGQCLHPLCDREAYTRGLCSREYNAANELVRQKKTTWRELEKAGKCLPSRKQKYEDQRKWFLEKPQRAV
jgi:hypothetical protein